MISSQPIDTFERKAKKKITKLTIRLVACEYIDCV
jgi:hypothetical protein